VTKPAMKQEQSNQLGLEGVQKEGSKPGSQQD